MGDARCRFAEHWPKRSQTLPNDPIMQSITCGVATAGLVAGFVAGENEKLVAFRFILNSFALGLSLASGAFAGSTRSGGSVADDKLSGITTNVCPVGGTAKGA